MKIFETVFNLQSRHEYMVEMTVFNVQRTITTKVGKSALRYMCSACCLMVLYICVKFLKQVSLAIQHTIQVQ